MPGWTPDSDPGRKAKPPWCATVRGGRYGSFDPLEGQVRHVPRDYPTIQAAIDAAHDGDLVLVANGVYQGAGNKNLSWDGRIKHLTVKSANGPLCAVIDCEGDGRAFVFADTLQNHLDVIDGFTMQNGNSQAGGDSTAAGPRRWS